MNNQAVGRVALSPDQRLVFEYDSEWLRYGFSISPLYLPLQPGAFTAKATPFQGNFGVFADSLPDGWGNLLLDRVLRKNGIYPYDLTLLQRLALVGQAGMGALEYTPELTFKGKRTDIDFLQLAADIAQILRNEADPATLEQLYLQAGSSAGARPKIMLRENGKQWLVKFPASSDPQDIGHIEYKYSILARKAGLEMPETRLVEDRFFCVRRFDRKNKSRIHVASAAGLLHADFRLPSLDYADIIKATRMVTRNEMEVLKMFRLMVFNVLIGNRDDHAKNFSFVFESGEWKCSPVYDLLPSRGMNGQHFTSIAGSGTPTEADVFAVAKQTSIPLAKAKAIFEECRGAILS